LPVAALTEASALTLPGRTTCTFARRALALAAAGATSALTVARSALTGAAEATRQAWLSEAAEHESPAEKFRGGI